MKKMDLKTASEKVLTHLDVMTDDELFTLLDECADDPVGRAFFCGREEPEYIYEEWHSTYVINDLGPYQFMHDGQIMPVESGCCWIDKASNDSQYLLAA